MISNFVFRIANLTKIVEIGKTVTFAQRPRFRNSYLLVVEGTRGQAPMLRIVDDNDELQ